jgi:hypothetical protein
VKEQRINKGDFYRYAFHTQSHLMFLLYRLSLQIVYTGISLSNNNSSTQLGAGHIPWYVLTLGLVSSPLTFLINEVVKQEEIK